MRKTIGVAAIVLAVALTGCGSSTQTSHTGAGKAPAPHSWPATLDNTMIAGLYNTANDSSTITDCVPATDPSVQNFYTHVDAVGTSTSPVDGELVSCAFAGHAGGAVSVTLGPVGAATWTDPQDLNPSLVHVAKVIPGSGTLDLPYTQPDGWRWQIAYSFAGGYSAATAVSLAHAVAANLAANLAAAAH